MQTAYCKLDGKTYYAQQFFELPQDEITEKRYDLVCIVCGCHAFFRLETINGREACFGAYHAEGCQMAAIQTTIDKNRPDQNRDYANNHEQHIVVDFAYGTAQTEEPINHTAIPNQFDDGCHSGGRVARQNIVSHRRLSSILRDLIASPEFRDSHRIIHVAGLSETTVCNFFVQFDQVTNAHVGRFMGYWGRLTSVGIENSGEFWLNTGYRGTLSIFVPSHLVDALRSRFRLDDTSVVGAYVLVFGTFQIGRSGKPFIEVADLCSITMSNPPSH